MLPEHELRVVGERAVDVVLERARQMLRHASRPTRRLEEGLPSEGELDFDATVERPRPWQPEDIRTTRTEPREASVVAVLDMSLSMTGEKIALVALATAILALKLDGVAVVAFDTTPHVLVEVGEVVPPRELIRRILEVPAQGYTNIEAGLAAARDELKRSHRPERVAILMSDGVQNIGKDPVRTAASLPRLHVIQVGSEDKQGTRACQGMVHAGHGRLFRAETYERLPEVVSKLVREVFR